MLVSSLLRSSETSQQVIAGTTEEMRSIALFRSAAFVMGLLSDGIIDKGESSHYHITDEYITHTE